MTAPVLPPHNKEAEESVLGALLLKPDSIHEISDLLTEEHFYLSKLGVLYACIAERVRENKPVDALLLGEILDQTAAKGLFTPSDLLELANNTASAANIRAYAEIVLDRSLRRSLLEAASGIAKVARASPSGLQAVSEAAKELAKIRLAQSGGLVLSSQVMKEAWIDLSTRFDLKQDISGLSTGLADLDEALGGMQDDDLIIIAARPSMGKTALALNIAHAVAGTNQQGVAVFSMEMSRKQLAHRQIASHASVNMHCMKNPSLLTEADWPRVTGAQTIIGSWHLAIDDTGRLTTQMLRARCLRMHAKYPLRLVVIDYLQLLEFGDDGENRATKIAEASRDLKMLAKELGCPVIALSQLNRGLEQRSDKRPMMSDLRESGAIEQDADTIIAIYRDEVYHRGSQDKGTAELIILKQRSGPLATVRVKSVLQYARFENLDDDWKPEGKPAASKLPQHLRMEMPG